MKKYHFCLNLSSNSLWEALEMKAWSPDKFMDVTSVKVPDEDGYLIRNMTIKNEQQDCDGANLDQSCHQRDNVSAF